MKARILDVDIRVRPSTLEELGASRAEFTAALEAALESLAGKPRGQLPRAADIPISILGTSQRLGALATIAVRVGDSGSDQPEPGWDPPVRSAARAVKSLNEPKVKGAGEDFAPGGQVDHPGLQPFESAAQIFGQIDQRARTPMILRSPGVAAAAAVPARPEIRAE